ncbi:hypothetical protein V502_10985 [Pseudogymnoascus sp. VKM F-4520 (FW-2644)]|nr:hypothetical protein V502_10985 [Pseudogymnoascus sp. VKM F-4520 (FW-2644)]
MTPEDICSAGKKDAALAALASFFNDGELNLGLFALCRAGLRPSIPTKLSPVDARCAMADKRSRLQAAGRRRIAEGMQREIRHDVESGG